jgi:hypothetical protein
LLVIASRLLIPKGLFVSAAAFGIYIAYVYAIYLLVPDGYQDPVYRITGIIRFDQIVGVSVLFGVVVMAILIHHMRQDGRLIDFASNPATRRGTVLLLVLIFLNGVAASLEAVLYEVNSQFWAPLYTWVAVVLALQALIVYTALSRIRHLRTHLVLLTALSVFNLFALYIDILASFQSLPDILRAAIIAFALLSFAMLFTAVGKRIMPVRGVNTVLVVMLIGSMRTPEQ